MNSFGHNTCDKTSTRLLFSLCVLVDEKHEGNELDVVQLYCNCWHLTCYGAICWWSTRTAAFDQKRPEKQRQVFRLSRRRQACTQSWIYRLSLHLNSIQWRLFITCRVNTNPGSLLTGTVNCDWCFRPILTSFCGWTRLLLASCLHHSAVYLHSRASSAGSLHFKTEGLIKGSI